MSEEIMASKERMTRRGFVGAALVGSMGLAASSFLAGCSSAPKKEGSGTGDSWTEEADVVVIGSGGGGFAAAIEAANAGSSVLLLERGTAVGGDSALCDGILGGAPTRLAKEQGITATTDDVYKWFMAHPEWYGPKDPAVARVLADESGKTIDWLQDNGVPFEKKVAPRFGYTELPVIHQVDGKGANMIKVLAGVAEKAGVKTLLETRAVKIISNEEGRAIGVEAMQKKDPVRFKAKKGVVVATGGHSGSKGMIAAMNPECAAVMPGSNPGATGDGLAMAMDFGVLTGRTSDFPLLSSLAGLDTKSIVNINYSERLHGLWLDANGERFFNEETPYENPLGHRAIVRKQNEQGGKPVVILLPTTPELEAVLAVRPINWVKGNTVEEVAAAIGLDGAKVKATVDRYNGFCAAGRDDDFGRPAEFLIPMTGPFYASTIMASTSVTTGGIRTNDKGQALKMKSPTPDADPFEVIPGLYATGVVCEWNCAAGSTVLSAMALGRIAGQNVAQEKPTA